MKSTPAAVQPGLACKSPSFTWLMWAACQVTETQGPLSLPGVCSRSRVTSQNPCHYPVFLRIALDRAQRLEAAFGSHVPYLGAWLFALEVGLPAEVHPRRQRVGAFAASKETAGILDLPSVWPSILLAFGRVNPLTKELCLHLSLSALQI